MKQPCGCCVGVEVAVPEAQTNRPGLPAIAYRVGTHATFFESMVARLSTLYIDIAAPYGSGKFDRVRPLGRLTTRDPADPAIALLDAWALLGDVLSFYQERIANEGYLRTARERRSILELARLIGYKLRPGVSATVYLAFTVADGFAGEIPPGTRAQSIPGAGERPQFFETAEKFEARDSWNNLKPRLTRPEVITLNTNSGTDAASRDTLYFQGISTNLKPGDALLIVLGEGSGQQALRFVRSVDIQTPHNRTEVILQEAFFQVTFGDQVLPDVKTALEPFIGKAASIFSGSRIAAEIAQTLQELIARLAASDGSTEGGAELVQSIIPQIREQHDFALRRKFTRLAPWIASLLSTLEILVAELPNLDISPEPPGGPPVAPSLPGKLAPSPLGKLGSLVGALALAPSLQPANAARLGRNLRLALAPQADAAPRLLAQFHSAAAPTLYKAWANAGAPANQARVYAIRVKASVFGHNAPLRITGVVKGVIQGYAEWPVAPEKPNIVLLDGSHDKITPDSWLVIETPLDNPADRGIVTGRPLYAKVKTADAGVSGARYGVTGSATQIELMQPDDPSQQVNWLDLTKATVGSSSTDFTKNYSKDFAVIRKTTVYAQPELLELAEEPLDVDLEGDGIELAQLYDGLEAGRWVIVSGERTDIPDVTGVKASELVMISSVLQGARALGCAEFPGKGVPFSQALYTTAANSFGDRLVVGILAHDPRQFVPEVAFPNQRYCDQVELAPGLYADAYVPSDEEIKGNFGAFEGLLVDPETKAPFPKGKIAAAKPGSLWAWRVSSEKVHSILALANRLAYTYDAATVTIYGNVAKATHGQTQGEVLGDGDGSQALQKFAVRQAPLTYLSAPTPAGAESTLVVRVNEVEWHETDSLVGLGPTDRNYITETDDEDRTTVIFGSGERGARVPSGTANVKAVYRNGIGKPGNVKAEQISQLATQPLGVKGVINPLAASGGADRDSADRARENAPLAVMALDRLVSVRDYADFARTFAGIGKASAERLSDRRRLIVYVTVAGADDIPIDQNSDLYRNLVQALLRSGDPHQALQVAMRRLKLLVISAGVKVMADYSWDFVAPKARQALLDAYSFERRALGQSVFLSEATAVLQAVEGVEYVDVRIFDSVAESVGAAELAGLGGTLTLRDAIQAELAWVDETATDPAKRIRPAEIVVLTPDVPDTLILTVIP